MERILGLDLGSRTCGIAISDTLGMLAHGIETYRFRDDDYDRAAKHVVALINEHQIKTVVLGLPKHMNGDLGERAQISIMFKEQLIFADVSRKKRKQVIDKMAAVAILQGYLDAQ